MPGGFRLPIFLALTLALALALALAGCGRKGTLERPAGATTAQPAGEDQPAESEAGGKRAPNRPFILDRLVR